MNDITRTTLDSTNRAFVEYSTRVYDATVEPLRYFCDTARHLVCVPYTVDNLHRAARELGIKKCWFHNSKNHPHYDIPKLRIAEISAKCTVVSSREILAIMKTAGHHENASIPPAPQCKLPP